MELNNTSQEIIETRSQKIDRWIFCLLWVLLVGSWLYLLSQDTKNLTSYEEFTIPASEFAVLIAGLILSFATPKRIFERRGLKKWYWGGLQFLLTLSLLLLNVGGLVYYAFKDCC